MKNKDIANNPYGLSINDRQWMREAAITQLKGCRVQGPDGTWLHTPDGVGNYKAQWTRDTYYMIEYAGDLLDQNDIRAAIDYLLNGQREDGCIPDRVNIEGKAVYSPGPPNKPMADHALDNGSFMALMVCSYLDQYDDKNYFKDVEIKLRKGMDQINLSDYGLVYNDPDNPQCVYGFTDIVKKTGNLLFSSLIYYHACVQLKRHCKRTNCGDAEEYGKRAELIKKNIYRLWDDQSGMFMAADRDCRQIDIWGNAYAIEVGITSPEQEKKISDYLISNYEQIVQRGQVRHLPAKETHWQQLFHSCEEGTYQNGAFRATPLAWIVPVYGKYSPEIAQQMLQEVINDFQANGINECINGEYLKVPDFVVSATNVYALTR